MSSHPEPKKKTVGPVESVPKRPEKDGAARRRLKRLALFFGGLVILFGGGWAALHFVPLPAELFTEPSAQVEITDRRGESLRAVRPRTQGFAEPVTFAEIPPSLVQATVSAEDKRFWDHVGVDWLASGRAAWQLLRYRRVLSGGSTISQQLIKLAQPRPRTFKAKFLEAVQALRLEQVWAKQRILTEYLNRLDYGNMNVGCAAAAEFYFGKPLGQLSAAECALLAGLPQAPSRLNPIRNFERANRRRAWVLDRMRINGYLTAEEHARAVAEPVVLAAPRRAFRAPHFVDLLLARAAMGKSFAEALHAEASQGVVRTTLDLEWNRAAEGIVRDHLARLKEHRVNNAAAVVIENRTGAVRVLVGSEDYFDRRAGQVNGAWAPRSAGSTFKPFTYLLALEAGATPATVIADVPAEFATATGIFAPMNYDRQWRGPVRLRGALANSLNVPAVRTLRTIGGPAPLQERLRACGLTTLTGEPEYYGLGLTIGNAEARLLELANAYACLARLGVARPWTCLEKPGQEPLGGQRVFAEAECYLIADILSDNEARSLAFGLESPLRFEFPVAAKTGTSSDFRDNWAFGYTPEFTVGVWVGNFDGEPMREVSGVSGAAPILHGLIAYLHPQVAPTWYAQPTVIESHRVHALSGKRAAELPLAPAGDYITEKFVNGRVPEIESATDYDESGRARLSAEYASWLQTTTHPVANRIVAGASPKTLRIKFPLPGTIFYLNRDLPDNGGRITPEAESGGKVEWASETLKMDNENGRLVTVLAAGHHRLRAVNAVTGATAETQFEVRWK